MLTVLTVATSSEKAVPFMRSCYGRGVYPAILGIGCHYPFNGVKIHYIRQALEAIKGVVVYADAYDCTLVNDIEQMERQFLASGKDVIFAAEKNCYPDAELAPAYSSAPTDYRFLNSGCFIGHSDKVKAVLDDIKWDEHNSDQLLITQYFLKNRDKITLDYHCEFFHCMFMAELDLTYGDRIKNHVTDTEPFIIHGNGHSDMTRVNEWAESKTNLLLKN